ncbi:MAG: ABC transporter ATP-binding protein [Halobacteriovoraceae bacterium]|nr:ABC transporter ATP-binding protein [Halobacteriovoraceae bacterium]
MDKILEIKDLEVEFATDKGPVKAIRNVSFDVYKGRTLGLVGESGSGKSVTALSIMGLIPNPPGRVTKGEILYNGRNLLALNSKEMRKIRGNKISMIFQEPMTSLNPVYTIGNQINEVVKLHIPSLNKKERIEKSIDMLKLVGIPDPEKRYNEYPHQMSGGMRQRIMIAISLICGPDILIADEPTTALDVTIQAQILELMLKLQEEFGMGIIFITHDLGVVSELCHDVAVMYCGKIVEKTSCNDIFKHPLHPYTEGLINSVPRFDSTTNEKKDRLITIPGIVPSLFKLPKGCSFQDRCSYVSEDCKGVKGCPELSLEHSGHWVSCFRPLLLENNHV